MEISVCIKKVTKKDAGCDSPGGSMCLEQDGGTEGKTGWKSLHHKGKVLAGTWHSHCVVEVKLFIQNLPPQW